MIEINTFRLADGIDEDAFLAADRAVQTAFVPNLAGFVRRTTARGDDGDWIVITLWESSEAAEDAAKLAEHHPATAAFSALVNPGTFDLRRYTTLD